MSPWALVFGLSRVAGEGGGAEFCIEIWPPSLNPNLYFLLGNLFLVYLLPLSLISLCYFSIWLRVWRRQVPSDSDSFSSNQLSRVALVHSKAKVSVLKSVLVVVLAFALSWLPLYTLFIRIKLGGPLSPFEEEVAALAAPVAQWLGSANSSINPILYVSLFIVILTVRDTGRDGMKLSRDGM
jgi:hypothetical protein